MEAPMSPIRLIRMPGTQLFHLEQVLGRVAFTLILHLPGFYRISTIFFTTILEWNQQKEKDQIASSLSPSGSDSNCAFIISSIVAYLLYKKANICVLYSEYQYIKQT